MQAETLEPQRPKIRFMPGPDSVKQLEAASFDMFFALKGLEVMAQEMVTVLANDSAAGCRESRLRMVPWVSVLSAIDKAEGR